MGAESRPKNKNLKIDPGSPEKTSRRHNIRRCLGPSLLRSGQADSVLLETAFFVLLAQLVGTALYFTGKFSNPQVHKELIAQFCAAVAVGLWLLAQAIRGGVRFRVSVYYFPVLFLITWSAIRTLTSVTPLSTRKWIMVAQVAAALPVWVELLESPRRRLMLSWAIFLIGIVMAGGALIESFGYYPHPLTSQYHRQSIGSFVGHNNPMAAYLLMASVHTFGLWLRFREKRWSMIFWLVLLVDAYLIILSGSRGVWLSIPFVAVVFFICLRGLRWIELERALLRRVAVSVSACLVAAVIAAGAYTFLKQDTRSPTILDRIRDLRTAFSGTYPRVWTMSLLMVNGHPFTGVGFAAWAHQYAYYQGDWFERHPQTQLGLPGMDQHTQRAHCDYLQVPAELGLIGLFGLLWLLAVHIRKAYSSLAGPETSLSASVGLVAMTGTMAHALVYFPFHAADSASPFLANWGLFASGKDDRERVLQASGPCTRPLLLIGAVFFLLLGTRPVGKWVTADVLTGQMWLPLPAGQRSPYGDWPYKGGALFWQNWAAQFESAGNLPSVISALREAKYALEKSLQLDPNAPEARHHYGRVSFSLANAVYRAEGTTDLYREAEQALEKSLETYVWHGTYHLLAQCRAALWRSTGDDSYYRKAVESHLTGLKIYPVNYNAVAELGKLYHDHGDDQATMTLYYETQARFSGLEEQFVDVLYRRAEAAWRANRVEEANFYLSVVCALDEQDPEKRFALAVFYVSQQQPENVLHVLRQHFRLDPCNTRMTARLFDVWIRRGGAQQAQAVAAELFSTLDPGPCYEDQVRMSLASFLLHGEYALADEILAQLPLEQVPSLAKDRALTQWMRGDVLGAMGRWTGRLRAHRDDPDSLVGLRACLDVLFGFGGP